MGLTTHLGPQLTGTVKNPIANIVTANTISPNYLVLGNTSSNTGGYRNVGVGDASQSCPLISLVGVPTGSFPYTYYPYTTLSSGFLQPIVIPAGSLINSMTLDITTAFTFGGTPTGFTMGVNVIGAPGTTYASATAIVNHGTTGALTSWTTAQRNQIGTGTNFTWATGGTAVGYLANTGTTDTMLQLTFTFTAGTSPTVTAGAATLSINYCLRNFDGSWYPQSPVFPITNPPTVTY